MRILGIATILLVNGFSTIAVAAAPTINWEIENRFRYFTKASDFQKIADVYLSLKTAKNPKPSVLQLERALESLTLAGKFNNIQGDDRRNGWASSVFLHTCGRQPDHRHSSCKTNGDSYLNPQKANVILQVSGVVAAKCAWFIDNVPKGIADCAGKLLVENVSYNEPHHLVVKPESGTGAPPIDFTMKDALVISMGDSFSAGEGNPEQPATFTDDSYNFYRDSSVLHGVRQAFPVREDLNLVGPGEHKFFGDLSPSWTNTQCHRSTYSQHTRAALQYALEHPHVSVTFMNYSCTGAEVYQGILNAWWARDDVAESRFDDAPQIVKALRDLCKDSGPFNKTDWSDGDRNDDAFNLKAAVIPKCSELIPKKIDALLLSIGGNDVGFARMISNAAVDVPTTSKFVAGRSWIYGLWRAVSGPQTFAAGLSFAKTRIPGRYRELSASLKSHLDVAPYRVVLSAYPDVTTDEDGARCKPGNVGMDAHVILGMYDPRTSMQSSNFVNHFHDIMQKESSRQGWRFADQHFVQKGSANSFTLDADKHGHGICAQGPSTSQEGNTHLPRPKLDAPPPYVWHPFPPSKWAPYSDRNRWLVTPNDSFLTANYHDANTLIQDVIQPVYAATLSGSFHPNALGHAALADSVLIELRKVLGSFED